MTIIRRTQCTFCKERARVTTVGGGDKPLCAEHMAQVCEAARKGDAICFQAIKDQTSDISL